MNYHRIKATAEAKRYSDEKDAQEREAQNRAVHGDNRLQRSRVWIAKWNERQALKLNTPGNGPRSNEESVYDDQDRREAPGPQAGPGSAGEGVGDTAPQEAAGSPPGRGDDQDHGGTEEAAQAPAENEGRPDDGRGIGGPLGSEPAPGEASWLEEAYPEALSEGASLDGEWPVELDPPRASALEEAHRD